MENETTLQETVKAQSEQIAQLTALMTAQIEMFKAQQVAVSLPKGRTTPLVVVAPTKQLEMDIRKHYEHPKAMKKKNYTSIQKIEVLSVDTSKSKEGNGLAVIRKTFADGTVKEHTWRVFAKKLAKQQ